MIPQAAEPTDEQRIPVVEVVITEEFDVSVVHRMASLLEDALALRPRELVVDLAACPLLDASAIGLLVDVHRRARRAGSELTLRTVSPRLQRNLMLARADRVLQVAPGPTVPLGGRRTASTRGCDNREWE